MEVKVTKKNEALHIKWQLSNIEIPFSKIIEVLNDDTYAGKVKNGIRIGLPYGHTERVVINTDSETYIIYTNNAGLKEKIHSFMN
ncbi:hypothetical protein D8M04_04030 [Oceanobacillus piezotolerans]|uniref:Sublancin immunity protein SunI-like PH domain-containing protein n=1 Tax=Oceanobacillus piezotolerans TaxID=2448030 RepID=A0A498DUA5_9BACI|nr:hypothetical protein [Oceanobacillus piezotolerans]RLL48437.1 hypothetical protein D8M04_04030 [Oceanobacillus piezotolerans]